MKGIFLIFGLTILSFVSLGLLRDPTPPKWSPSFSIAFDQTYVIANKSYTFNGQFLYDVNKNRQRADKLNGKYDAVCSSILPNITTKCQHLVVDNKRYIVFPEKQQCCMCCDASHGCGVVKQDWFADGQYLGKQRIIDTQYDKWGKADVAGAFYWTTADQNQIPRRFEQSNRTHIIDYLSHTFINQTFPDSVFALPKFCNSTCPLSTVCGKFRQNPQLLSQA